MIKKFINWLKSQIGSIYVWGAQGEIDFNEAWIKKVETSERNAERAIAFLRKQKAKGIDPIAAYDCSGLIVRFFLDNDIIQSDMSSRGLYSLCKAIDQSSLLPGDLVFRHNGNEIHHVGVFIGDGKVIHSKGRDVGVVMEDINATADYWNRFGRFEALSLTDSLGNFSNTFPKQMEYSGSTYVNLRSMASAASEKTIIDKVYKKESVLVLAIKGDWAEVIKKKEDSSGYVRGFCIAKWLKESA